MAQGSPDALRLRELKYSPKIPDSERSSVARRLLECGRAAEALDLFLLAGDDQGVQEISALAKQEARVILLVALVHAGRKVSAADWKQAGDRACAEERWREAFRAYSEAGDEPGLEKVRAEIPDYELWSPQGK